jgi:acyl-coenzyme A synthetase/AMP-(fatty) acid ligase
VRLITIGADRPHGGSGFTECVDSARSEVEVTPRSAGDLTIVGYTSGTTGLLKGAMISQGGLTECIRLMPSCRAECAVLGLLASGGVRP